MEFKQFICERVSGSGTVHGSVDIRNLFHPPTPFRMLEIHDLRQRPVKMVGDKRSFLVNLVNRIPHDPYRGRGARPFPA
jgi:hypothetical protein